MASGVTILDGGMGRELLRMGAPFRQPEWSALALIEAPELVGRAHRAFLDAGAQIVTTNSYALVPFHIGPEWFAAQGQALADLAGRIAREAADESGSGASVAGSLPPLFGSYRPDLFDPELAPDLLRTLVEGLSPHVDLWLGETLSATAEAAVIRQVLGSDRRPLWLSFTLADELTDGRARLRSGEHVARAAVDARALGAVALLFNCSPPEVMAAAIAEAATVLSGSRMRLGAYANAFAGTGRSAANGDLSPLRADTGPVRYLELARGWIGAGASVIGGCCGIGPEHIRGLAVGLG
ncbi:MAG TPA: homocysteine S-methyltransferase family protein [Geminicoccus sp.]|uniref:homocysteine S-methyltransferase family protein n=1 Tax=Geminicoccus sp. TaxID=2024832 RepID=UPI002C8B0867|nr:homocysteine S-methyltransferase family protein [Geminicoccus sp.]HWL68464.1 homocysteine S-methyltransferase family protein [Geminicoccus sp.]